MPEAERATLTLCCTHSNCTKVAASETNVRTNRHTHTGVHTQAHTHTHTGTDTPAHTHSTRHTHRYTFYFIIPALSFILLYFTSCCFFRFYFNVFYATFFPAPAVVVCIFRIWYPPSPLPRTKQKATPAQDQRISVCEPVALNRHRQCFALSNDLCVAPTAAVIM